VELAQLKQPAADIGPLRLFHDHAAGATRADCGADPLAVLRASPSLTARALAAVLFETADLDRNQVQRARRRLDGLVKAGLAICVDGHKGGIGGGTPTIYVASCDSFTGHGTDRGTDHGADHADHVGAITASTP